jgi:hypothetical protein
MKASFSTFFYARASVKVPKNCSFCHKKERAKSLEALC